MRRLRHGELFAGYGGLGLAVADVFGAEHAWVSEIERAPSAVLAHHWPTVPNYGDITRIDWASIEPVDIISGGSPCQDLSLAGSRAGMDTGTRSNLWESMCEGIATIRPRFVVWENVRGALSARATSSMESATGHLGESGSPDLRAFGRVLGDLASLGYDAQWRGLRASDVGAPHTRFRLFLLASLPDSCGLGLETLGLSSGSPSEIAEPSYGQQVLSDSDVLGHERSRQARGRGPGSSNGGQAAWGEYAGAVARWESVNGPAPRPTEHNERTGKLRLSPAFAEWMMGLNPGHVTGVPGLSWSDQIRLCGNGVVPQQAAAALRSMLS